MLLTRMHLRVQQTETHLTRACLTKMHIIQAVKAAIIKQMTVQRDMQKKHVPSFYGAFMV